MVAAIDLFSRSVVGWSISDTITVQFNTDALIMVVWRRGEPDVPLYYSDQGISISVSSSSG